MRSAGIVLAGGRSSRMGAPKATLEWHGSTLLRRVTGLVARAVDGPLVVVRAPGQELPPLPGVEVVDDAREGRGPLQGLLAGLAAVAGRADVAYVSSTDVPFLDPAFVARVVAAVGDAEVAVPVAGGFPQPLAAAYRVALLARVEGLVADGRMRMRDLLDVSVVRELEGGAPADLNEPGDYEAARALPAPRVRVAGVRDVRAATLGAVGVRRDRVRVNGVEVAFDPELPLVEGDELEFGRAP
jgi:molybdopterin-guanine dinucleotide biosynthesis protein A